MNYILSIILLILLILIGGKRGLKTYLIMYINLFFVMLLIMAIGMGLDPLLVTFISVTLIALVILFFLNGFNKKTISSFISVFIILLLLICITYIFGKFIYIQGYSEETIEAIGYVNYNTGLNMLKLTEAIIIIGLIGNIIDTSIAISSALYEVHVNNPNLKIKELFKSGMNIGGDILGTTTNTLFFAFLGGAMSLLIYFIDYKYGLLELINSKVFALEFTKIVLSGIAAFLIIPLTSYISSIIYKKELDTFDITS